MRGVAQTGEEVGADLTAAEDFDGGIEGFEVGGDVDFGFAGHDFLAHGFVPGFEMHSEGIDSGVLELLEPGKVGGRFALRLDGESGGGLDGGGAFGEDFSAAVGGGRGAGGEDDVFDAVEFLRGLGDFGELFGSLAGDGLACFEGFADGAELAFGVLVAVANAGLENGGGENVGGMQGGDFAVGDAVGGLETVKVGLGWKLTRERKESS